MKDIKTKERNFRFIKTIDKTVLWTERIKDPVVYLNEKTKKSMEEQDGILDYGVDKIKFLSNRAKDEMIYSNKKSLGKIGKFIKNNFRRNKFIKVKLDSINPRNTLKISDVAQENIKRSKKVFKNTKSVIHKSISIIKNIIKKFNSLIKFLISGGIIAVAIIIIICIFGMLFSSIYGIFFSSENIGDNTKMSTCVQELNLEMDKQINFIINTNPHDEVIIHSNKANWRDILSIYAVKVYNGNTNSDVILMDEEKKKVLKEIFWNMNFINYETKIEFYEDNTIGFTPYDNTSGNKNVLHIYITSVDADYMKDYYNFNELQIKELNELLLDKNNNLWSSVIYGAYSSSGELTEWKQRNREWSNIKIGTTNSSIGDIGCLVTSISILIKKSGVSTNDIYPFNPGTFVIALNNNYGFDTGGNLYYSAISKVVPDFVYQGHVNLRDKSKSDKFKEIKKYYEQGYYIAIEVGGATRNSQHWVAIDNISDNKILMLDPATYYVDMWDRYDFNNTTQFVYFKVNK